MVGEMSDRNEGFPSEILPIFLFSKRMKSEWVFFSHRKLKE